MSDAPRLQGPGRQNDPDPMADLVDRFVRLKQQVDDLGGSILKSAGIRAVPGKIASTDWDGTDHDDLGAVGWVLGRDGTGPSYLALNGVDLAELIESQIELDSDWNRVTGFAIPAGYTEYVSATITVPPNCTQMHFDAIATMYARNSTASTHNLYAGISRQINGAGEVFGSETAASSVSAGWWTTVTAVYKWATTVTPGDVHRFWLEAAPDSGSGAWASNVDHRARLDVSAMFTR